MAPTKKPICYSNLIELGPPTEHFFNDFVDSHFGSVQQPGICGRFKRRHRAFAVTAIPLFQIPGQRGQIGFFTASFKLLHAPLSAYAGRSRHKDLEFGFRENHRPHVAPVGNESGSRRRTALQVEKRLPHPRHSGALRSSNPHGFGADGFRHIFAVEPNAAILKLRRQRAAAVSAAGSSKETFARKAASAARR